MRAAAALSAATASARAPAQRAAPSFRRRARRSSCRPSSRARSSSSHHSSARCRFAILLKRQPADDGRRARDDAPACRRPRCRSCSPSSSPAPWSSVTPHTVWYPAERLWNVSPPATATGATRRVTPSIVAPLPSPSAPKKSDRPSSTPSPHVVRPHASQAAGDETAERLARPTRATGVALLDPHAPSPNSPPAPRPQQYAAPADSQSRR